jgi:hypothetical protein
MSPELTHKRHARQKHLAAVQWIPGEARSCPAF